MAPAQERHGSCFYKESGTRAAGLFEKEWAMRAQDSVGERDMGKVSPADRRRFPRKALKVDVTFESETNFFQGFSANISEGGLFIVTHDIQPIGSEVDVEFFLPDEDKESIRTRAEVRWVREYDTFKPEVDPGMGVRFLSLDDRARTRVERFMKKREPLFYDD